MRLPLSVGGQVLLGILISVPFVAYASGFFSFFGHAAAASQSQNDQNSQTMQLLSFSGGIATSSAHFSNQIQGDALSPDNAAPTQNATGLNSASDQISLYVVRDGDTLSGIAKMFDVSVNTIVWANNIKNGKVSPGDKLVILPITGVEYTVKRGDTLASIAKKLGGDATEIAQYNNVAEGAALTVGTTILIPDGEIGSTQTQSEGSLRTGGASSAYSGSSPTDTSGSNQSGAGGYIPGIDNGVGTSPLASGALPAPSGSPIVGARGPHYPVYVDGYERPVIGGVKTQGIHGHNGIDLSASYGTPILAAADGTVIVARSGGWNGGYGSYIVISHPNGTQTLYAHLSGINVEVGEGVDQGQVIGRMGETGDATGVHLHFEIRGAPNPF